MATNRGTDTRAKIGVVRDTLEDAYASLVAFGDFRFAKNTLDAKNAEQIRTVLFDDAIAKLRDAIAATGRIAA